jgi:hypothetical protein
MTEIVNVHICVSAGIDICGNVFAEYDNTRGRARGYRDKWYM